ncbi:hypothetical protein CEXT_155621 [Caerostris extrusa]|uniref:Uncharacterized protein n=1 Tax=Caerostris extrusa TaxID=172846 RepID=A0AAV4MQY1_CAEEX|nr:hypothetical protein CEXT_155621 [Caerostris extrusa]
MGISKPLQSKLYGNTYPTTKNKSVTTYLKFPITDFLEGRHERFRWKPQRSLQVIIGNRFRTFLLLKHRGFPAVNRRGWTLPMAREEKPPQFHWWSNYTIRLDENISNAFELIVQTSKKVSTFVLAVLKEKWRLLETSIE